MDLRKATQKRTKSRRKAEAAALPAGASSWTRLCGGGAPAPSWQLWRERFNIGKGRKKERVRMAAEEGDLRPRGGGVRAANAEEKRFDSFFFLVFIFIFYLS